MKSPPCILMASAPWYPDITKQLQAGAEKVLRDASANIFPIETTGAFELPGLISMAAKSGKYDAYLALGCVIRGETSHYDLICNELARALMDLSLSGLPIGFGVLTCQNLEQAQKRASACNGGKGAEAAHACLRMLALSHHFSRQTA